MARRDLYFRLDDYSPEVEPWMFALNFFKGTVGIWCRIILLIGMAVSASTYLSGVIAFLAVGFVYLGGVFRPFIKSLIDRENYSGGPMESAIRLFGQQAGPLDQTAGSRLALGTDEVFRWAIQPIYNLFPDVERFNLNGFVAVGFDIPWMGVLVVDNLLPLAAYVLPWLILAYYLLKGREVASPC